MYIIKSKSYSEMLLFLICMLTKKTTKFQYEMNSSCNAVNMRHPKDISVTVTSIAGLGVPTSDVEETERICVPAVIVRLTNKLPRVLR